MTPSELLQELHHNLQQKHLIVRVLEGRESCFLPEQSAHQLFEQQFEVNSYSSRMALKLDGEPLTLNTDISMTTVPVIPGTLQLPSNGHPIVTLADGQTTGGYPRVGQVISADLNLLGQLKAKETVSFFSVTYEKAIAAYQQKLQSIQQLLQ